MKQKNEGCSGLFALAGLAAGAYLIFGMVRFFLSPNGIQSLLEFLKYAGMCLGLFILAFIIFGLYMRFFGGTSPNKIKRMSKDYAVRCYPSELDAKPGPANLSEQEAVRPVYVLISITNFGLSLAGFPYDRAWKEVDADNAGLFNRLSGDRSGPIILPRSYFQLNYVLYRQDGDLEVETAPPNEAGFAGSLADEGGKDGIKIIIIYTGFMEAENINHVITRERPLKLKMMVVDEIGRDDPDATRELYKAVSQYMQPDESDDDDSWMYRSRPIFW